MVGSDKLQIETLKVELLEKGEDVFEMLSFQYAENNV